MNIKINNNVQLSTDHPRSSHGCPVLVIDDAAYGPEDVIDDQGTMAGSAVVCSDLVCCKKLDGTSAGKCEMICRWLGQSSTHGPRWINTVKNSML